MTGTRANESIPAIVLDGHQRSALAAVRSLGRQGKMVVVAEAELPSLASSSRFCVDSLLCPDPTTQPEAFVSWLVSLDARYSGAVLMPMTDVTVPLVLRNRASIPSLKTALPSLAAYEAVTDKANLYELARTANVRVPRTCVVSQRSLSTLNRQELRFPVVIKPRRSVTQTSAGFSKRTVEYATAWEELLAHLDSMLLDDHDELLLQEYIEGRGEGLFVLYRDSRPVLLFAHRRIREKPPTGGVSVLSQSVPLRQELVGIAQRILDPLGWHGPAMLEFKVDAAGTPWLIEINARLWGSLQLAVDCGADFPNSLYAIACGDTTRPRQTYRTGRSLRWLLGDLDNLFLTLKRQGLHTSAVAKTAAVARFCVPWQPGMRYELLRLSDPWPAAFALRDYFRHAVATLKSKQP